MPRAELDPERILRALTARGVDFVVIGGIAAVLHGSPRNTFDLDICFATDRENLRALGDVLIGLGATLRGAEEDVPFVPDATTLHSSEVLALSTDAGDLDVLARPAGFPGYLRLRAAAERVTLGDLAILIASIPDLIAMKTAAGREKDIADVAELRTILRLRAAET